MPLQFDLIPAPVKGRMFESAWAKMAYPCVRLRRRAKPKWEKGPKPKRETTR